MTCKETRVAQLDSLKDGIGPADYILQINQHDGRIISKSKYKSREELEVAATKARKEWTPYAAVMLFACFQI